MSNGPVRIFVAMARWIGLLLVTGFLADYWVYEQTIPACHRDVFSESYAAGAASCHRALILGRPFQTLRAAEFRELLNDLGLAELKLQRLQTARDHLSEALQRYRNEVPEGSVSYAVTLNNLALLSQRKGDLKEQLSWSQASVDMFVKLGATCNEEFIRATTNLASALNSLGKSEEAEVILTSGTRQNAACQYIPAYNRGATLRVLGEVQTKNGREDSAIATFDAAIGLLREARGNSSLELAYTLVSRAMAMRALNRFDECKNDAMEAIPMLERFVGRNAPELGNARSVLGNALRMQGRLNEAMVEYVAAEAIYSASLNPNHPSRASLLINMAKASRGLGRPEESIALLSEAKRIRTIVFGSESAQVAAVQRALDDAND